MSTSNDTNNKRRWRGRRVGGYFQLRSENQELPAAAEKSYATRKKTRLSDNDSEHYKRKLWTLTNMW